MPSEQLESGFERIWRSEWPDTLSKLPPLCRDLYYFYRLNHDHRTMELPGYTKTLRETGHSDRTLRKYRRKLLSLGLITAKIQGKNTGEKYSTCKNTLYLCIKSPAKIQADTSKNTVIPLQKYSNLSTPIDKTEDKTTRHSSSSPVENSAIDLEIAQARANGRVCQHCTGWQGRNRLTYMCTRGHYSLPDMPRIALMCPDWSPKEAPDALPDAQAPGSQPDREPEIEPPGPGAADPGAPMPSGVLSGGAPGAAPA